MPEMTVDEARAQSDRFRRGASELRRRATEAELRRRGDGPLALEVAATYDAGAEAIDTLLRRLARVRDYADTQPDFTGWAAVQRMLRSLTT